MAQRKAKKEKEPVEKYFELSEDTVEAIKEIVSKMAMPFQVNFRYLGNAKQKTLIAVSKMQPQIAYMTNLHVLVQINEDYFDKFDEESKVILIRQELDRLQFDANSGSIKIAKPELTTSVGCITKYGIEAVARANKLQDLYADQQADVGQEQLEEMANALLSNTSSIEREFLS
jgi:phosphoribosylformylglycinamidine (FGAM) synthase PurS component